MYIFVKPCFIFWYSHTKLYFLRYCFVSSSIVTNPIKVVIQPHLYSLSVVRTIVAGRKKGFRQTTLYWAIYQNPFVLSRFWHLYYFSFDSRTTVSTWHERTESTSFAGWFVRIDPPLFLSSRS